MTAPVMVAEALALLAAVLAVLVTVGLGVVLLIAPDLDGAALLAVPAVGLALLYTAFQWLSPAIPSGTLMLLVLAVTGPLSLYTAVRHRDRLRSSLARRAPDLALLAAAGVGLYLVLLVPMFMAGQWTLVGPWGDGVSFYAPTTAYVASHTYPTGQLPFHTPVSVELQGFAVGLYPGSMGTFEGGLSVLTGLRPHELLDALDAACLVLVVAGTYTLVVGAMRLGRGTGAIAVALVVTNQYLVWTQDWTHAEESRGAVLMLCALTFAIHALRTGHTGAAILAGVSGQALMAVYFPIFGVLGVAAGGAALGAVVEALRAGATRRWARGLALIAVSGALAGAVNLRWLLVDGGFGNWVAQAVQVIPESSAYAITFPWTTDLGIAPIATLYRFEPILLWGDAWDAAAQTGALGLAAVVAAGLYALSRRRRLVEVGALTAGLGYAVVQRYDSASAYPAAKVFSYVLPLTAIAVAAGLAWIGSLSAIGPRRIRLPAGRLIAGTLLSALLLVQVVSTVETHAMFARLPDQLPADSLAMATLPDLVPAGAPTLLYDPAQPPQGGATVNTFVLFQAAYFLVGRDTIGPSDPFVPPQATGALPDAAHPLTPEQAGGYAFIVVPVGSPSPVPGFADFRLDWTGAGLQLYARSAAASQG